MLGLIMPCTKSLMPETWNEREKCIGMFMIAKRKKRKENKDSLKVMFCFDLETW